MAAFRGRAARLERRRLDPELDAVPHAIGGEQTETAPEYDLGNHDEASGDGGCGLCLCLYRVALLCLYHTYLCSAMRFAKSCLRTQFCSEASPIIKFT